MDIVKTPVSVSIGKGIFGTVGVLNSETDGTTVFFGFSITDVDISSPADTAEARNGLNAIIGHTVSGSSAEVSCSGLFLKGSNPPKTGDVILLGSGEGEVSGTNFYDLTLGSTAGALVPYMQITDASIAASGSDYMTYEITGKYFPAITKAAATP